MKNIQIKEFRDYVDGEDTVNNWLSDNPNIDIIDIKYSVGTFSEVES